MRLLIVTQKVDADDSNLGFFVRWIEEFAKSAAANEPVTVICLEEGTHRLPQNVSVWSLGKERLKRQGRGFKVLIKARYAIRFLRNIIAGRNSYDAVFVHMNPEYALLGGLVWRVFGKKSALWYVHKKVSLRLRLAALFVDRIFTASPESCRLRSRKVRVIGHGIDSALFEPYQKPSRGLHLVTVGRISPVKGLRTLCRGFVELKKKIPDARFTVIGEPLTDADKMYAQALQREFGDTAEFFGATPHRSVFSSGPYAAFVHASRTGGVDKAVLEALAAGLPVFTSSEAFAEEIPGVVKFREGGSEGLAEKIAVAFVRGELRYTEEGAAWVRKHHDLTGLISRIIASLR